MSQIECWNFPDFSGKSTSWPGGVRESPQTSWPWRSNSKATAKPMPLEAPVINTLMADNYAFEAWMARRFGGEVDGKAFSGTFRADLFEMNARS